MRFKQRWRWLALVAAFGLVAAACGGDDTTATTPAPGGVTTVAPTAAPQPQGQIPIRFNFAPDPVWDYLTDTGTLALWEVENNIRIITSSTWDEFTFFAGGHGDIVSTATQELPVLEKETTITTVSFGKYNAQRSPYSKRADSPYETLADIPKGSKLCVNSPVSNTLFWSVAANELHGLDYRVGGGDFELVVNDHFVNPELLANGECEGGAIIPEAIAPLLREGTLALMYGGLLPHQLYNTFPEVTDDGQKHIMSNLFTATSEWFDTPGNEVAAAAFLDLWEQGLRLWEENKADIVARYPQHFSVEAEEDIQFIIDFMSPENDWFVETVYLTQEWVDSEVKIIDFMKRLDPEVNEAALPEDTPVPRFEIIADPNA